ncbi:hypothetical protein STEG23_004706, partial [Scotinomys teguina]
YYMYMVHLHTYKIQQQLLHRATVKMHISFYGTISYAFSSYVHTYLQLIYIPKENSDSIIHRLLWNPCENAILIPMSVPGIRMFSVTGFILKNLIHLDLSFVHSNRHMSTHSGGTLSSLSTVSDTTFWQQETQMEERVYGYNNNNIIIIFFIKQV